MKRLWLVKDRPYYANECSNYYIVVRAEDEAAAIHIVKEKLKLEHAKWDVELVDNTEVWE